jgi:hypothetical protein
MTTSTNISGVIKPLGGVLRRQVPGKVYDIDEITPTGTKKKKRKKKGGVFEMLSFDGELLFFEARRDRKHTVNGKAGVWRTVRGRKHFFPDDQSGPIPPIKKGDGNGQAVPDVGGLGAYY